MLATTCLVVFIHLSGVTSQGAQNATTQTTKGERIYYFQRDGRVIKGREGSAIRTDVRDTMVMHHPVDISPGTVVSKNGGAKNRTAKPKEGATVYYVQRDGKIVMSKEGSSVRTDVTDKMVLNNPVGDPGAGYFPKMRIIETNALTHHLPNGTLVGEIHHNMVDKLHKAYPWNAIVAESPTVMKKSSIRSAKAIDQIIETANGQGGPRASAYPTGSGKIITELDMVMTHEQYLYYYEGRNLIQKPKRRGKRKALLFEFTYWPNGKIPYTVDSSFKPAELKLLLGSMQDWMDKTCIQFFPATDQTDVLSIENGHGCNSFVGRIGGKQSLHLQPACREFHVMKHELGHVLGLIHEHQRPDRDTFITVERGNVGTGRLKNYKKFAGDRISTYGVNYDYTSIMHYGKTAFSKDEYSTTMVTRDPNFQDIIGTTSTVSFKDAKIVNEMYKCAGHCRVKPPCGSGFVDKNCRCVCRDGTQSCSQSSQGRFNNRLNLRQIIRPTRTRNTMQPLRQTRRQQPWRTLISQRRQRQTQRLFPTIRQGPRQPLFPSTRQGSRQQLINTILRDLRQPLFPAIRQRPRQPFIQTIRQDPRQQLIQTIRQEPRQQLIQTIRQDPRQQLIQTIRQEPRQQLIQTRRQEPRQQLIQTIRQEPRQQLIQTIRQEPRQQLIQTIRQEPRQQLIQTIRQEPRQNAMDQTARQLLNQVQRMYPYRQINVPEVFENGPADAIGTLIDMLDNPI